MTADSQIEEIVAFMKNEAPDGWRELKMRCHFYDDAMEIKTHYRRGGEDGWASFSGEDFTLMDMCEALAEETHPRMQEKWTKLNIVVRPDGSHEYEFGYGDPGIFQS